MRTLPEVPSHSSGVGKKQLRIFYNKEVNRDKKVVYKSTYVAAKNGIWATVLVYLVPEVWFRLEVQYGDLKAKMLMKQPLDSVYHIVNNCIHFVVL